MKQMLQISTSFQDRYFRIGASILYFGIIFGKRKDRVAEMKWQLKAYGMKQKGEQ
jgi:hypothetical protein